MVRIVLLVFFTFVFGNQSYSSCKAPHYHSVDNLKSKGGLLRVSIDPQDFTLSKLICLSDALKQRHPEWRNVDIMIFTSKDFAKDFRAGANVELPGAAYRAQSQLHAIYSLDRDKHEEQLDILPFGWETGSSEAASIRLPAIGIPHCRWEIEGRCLYALKYFQYPPEALNKEISGTIVLGATITPAGKITNIHVERADTKPVAQAQVLIDAAMQDLSSWQLEPRKGQDSVRIVWRYIIDPSMEHHFVDANFESPGEVLVRGNP